MRDRVLLLFENGGVHGHEVRLYGRSVRIEKVRYVAACDVAAPPDDQIQQRGAAAALSEEGLRQIRANLSVYRNNAKIICDALDTLGIWYTGGRNSPYVWLQCPGFTNSFAFFDYLLVRHHENCQFPEGIKR